MNELIRWHDDTLYVNGWLLLALLAGIVAAYAVGLALGRIGRAVLGEFDG